MKTVAITFVMFLASCVAVPLKMDGQPAAAAAAKAEDVMINLAHKRQDDNNNNNYYRGRMTYYNVGLGACGDDDSGLGNTHNIVAISSSLMPAVGGGDMCGKKISIKGSNGKQVTATIRDKCPSCPEGGIDVSEKVFKEIVGDLGVGKTEVTWTIL
ncbi:RlpA-like double-psi beta-barrel-protein domain-containing protein-containing protein [Cladorrhinum samala]|uniref:RlpA-like double-psi beta-barrel-protein domain-containing protein-containing protein n=1 Tax=Cladorrhinum samala TaxID=585594 RepID=A0AAV9HXR3_9PEZI|nr:RlpA-like double-psi beta-barrel-protein domain-containing protein-containing protein [Cladorrhinum samala]